MRIRELNAYESTRNERNNTMKITSFNPQIITKNAEPILKLFKEIGVDDIDEAYQMLTERGFKNFYGDKAVEMKRAKSAMMISPSGFAINLIQHIKE